MRQVAIFNYLCCEDDTAILEVELEARKFLSPF